MILQIQFIFNHFMINNTRSRKVSILKDHRPITYNKRTRIKSCYIYMLDGSLRKYCFLFEISFYNRVSYLLDLVPSNLLMVIIFLVTIFFKRNKQIIRALLFYILKNVYKYFYYFFGIDTRGILLPIFSVFCCDQMNVGIVYYDLGVFATMWNMFIMILSIMLLCFISSWTFHSMIKII